MPGDESAIKESEDEHWTKDRSDVGYKSTAVEVIGLTTPPHEADFWCLKKVSGLSKMNPIIGNSNAVDSKTSCNFIKQVLEQEA